MENKESTPVGSELSATSELTGIPDWMVLIEVGIFQMGSNDGNDNEKPIHSVTVNRFYMSKYEVTNKEYKLFKSDHKGNWSDPDYPVENVSWYDAVAYCNWLSDKEGLESCYSGTEDDIVCDFSKNGYRLPTEAEWEYACRAGTTTTTYYYWGGCKGGDYFWYRDNSGNQVNKVGQKKPNSFGLYDMSGNVEEWCWDWYSADYYSKSSPTNPTGPYTGAFRVLRGGSYKNYYMGCRSACRSNSLPGIGTSFTGFRLARGWL